MTATCMYLCGDGSVWVYPWPLASGSRRMPGSIADMAACPSTYRNNRERQL